MDRTITEYVMTCPALFRPWIRLCDNVVEDTDENVGAPVRKWPPRRANWPIMGGRSQNALSRMPDVGAPAVNAIDLQIPIL
jgi:hypothetical protein